MELKLLGNRTDSEVLEQLIAGLRDTIMPMMIQEFGSKPGEFGTAPKTRRVDVGTLPIMSR